MFYNFLFFLQYIYIKQVYVRDSDDQTANMTDFPSFFTTNTAILCTMMRIRVVHGHEASAYKNTETIFFSTQKESYLLHRT